MFGSEVCDWLKNAIHGCVAALDSTAIFEVWVHSSELPKVCAELINIFAETQQIAMLQFHMSQHRRKTANHCGTRLFAHYASSYSCLDQ